MIDPRRLLHTPSARGGLALAVGVSALVAALAHADPAASGGAPPAPAADLQPPPITVLQSKSGVARGLIFVAPKTTAVPAGPQGPEIIDERGRPRDLFTNPSPGGWQEDAHTDVVHNFADVLQAYPEWGEQR